MRLRSVQLEDFSDFDELSFFQTLFSLTRFFDCYEFHTKHIRKYVPVSATVYFYYTTIIFSLLNLLSISVPPRIVYFKQYFFFRFGGNLHLCLCLTRKKMMMIGLIPNKFCWKFLYCKIFHFLPNCRQEPAKILCDMLVT